MQMEESNRDGEGPGAAPRLPAKSMIFDAGFSVALVSACQQFLGDGWTLLGAVAGAVLGPLGTLISWKAGGYARRGPLWPGWSKPLSRKWLWGETLFGLVWVCLLIDSIWHNIAAGLIAGVLFGTGSYIARLRNER